jgi:hypothetical protein
VRRIATVPFLQLASAPEYNGSVDLTLLIFHNPVSTRARHAACGGITPAKPGSAQASLARRARNLRNFHFLIYHGICCKSSVPFLHLASAPEYTGIVTFTLLGFHNPVSTRARHAAFGGITPAKPGSAQAKLARRARNLRNFHFLIYHGIVIDQAFRFFNLLLRQNTPGL